MKKYLYSIVFATLILFSTTAVNASNEVYYTNKKNIEMTEREYNNLLGLGFTEKQISRMDQELFLENKDLEGNVLGEIEKHYKITTVMRNGQKYVTTEEITKEEAKELQSQGPSRGPAPGDYYDGVSQVYNVITQVTKIIGVNTSSMRYMTTTTWASFPTDRYYDIIGLGLESNKVQRSTSMVFRLDWTDGYGVDQESEGCYTKYTNTGSLAVYKLPEDNNIQALEAMMYYNVIKQNNVGTITTLYAGGNYAHASSNVNPNNLLDYISSTYSTGVYVSSPYAAYYDTGVVAIASFEGTW